MHFVLTLLITTIVTPQHHLISPQSPVPRGFRAVYCIYHSLHLAYHFMPTSCPKVCFFLLFNFCREWSICLLYIHFCQPNRVPLAVKHFNTFVNLLYHPVPCKVNKIVAVWLAPSTLLLLCCLTEKIEIFSILLSVAKENRNRYDLSYTL